MDVNIPGNIPIPTWIGNICTFERNLEGCAGHARWISSELDIRTKLNKQLQKPILFCETYESRGRGRGRKV